MGIIVFGLSILLLLFIIKYKPVYKVTFLGKELGIVKSKENMENTIEEYTENKENNVAFISISEKPTYELKFVNAMSDTNEEEVLLAVEEAAKVTYRMYAITLENEQKALVASFEEAEEVVEDIKQELNKDLELDLKIVEVYDTSEIGLESVEVATAKLNEDEIIKEKVDATVNGVTLSKPITGTITSRFGIRSSGNHTGLDIANDKGTPIKASAKGIVKYAGWRGNYGNLVIIEHENGVETYYAHCNTIYVQEGETVNAGDIIAAVGSTGNSTGPHLHLVVRVDGNIINPQNYLYK